MTDFLDTFAELNAAFGAQDGAIIVAIDLVYEDPNQPRETFDEVELAELAASVRRRGALQPIVLRPADPDGRYMIRFGARRYRAARLAKLVEIRAFVRGDQAADADILIEQTLENDQRAALTTAERARTVNRLLGMGLSQADIARELGQPKDVIAMLAAVQKMPPAIQTLAKDLGARTLYELFGAWKRDRACVEAWLEGRDPRAITQAEARTLAARTPHHAVSSARSASSAARKAAAPRTGEAAAGAQDSLLEPVAAIAPAQTVNVLEVSTDGRIGVVDLARTPNDHGSAWVRFEDTGETESIALSELSLERVRPATGAGYSGPRRRRKG